MTRRSYRQHCALAKALDLVGDRWVLLIVRELLVGRRRFNRLSEALPAMGSNLLAARLKELEDGGIVQKVPLPDSRRSAYELTQRGRALERVVLALIRWGFPLLQERRQNDLSMRHWDVVALRAAFRKEAASGLRADYQFNIGNSVLHARVIEGRIATGLGPVPEPDVIVQTDDGTWSEVASGYLSLPAAIEAKRCAIEGDRLAIEKMDSLFRFQADRSAGLS